MGHTNETKRKVGDKVTIRSWKSMEKEYGLDRDGDIGMKGVWYFNKDIEYVCGSTYLISGIEGDSYTLEGLLDLNLCEYMFEKDNITQTIDNTASVTFSATLKPKYTNIESLFGNHSIGFTCESISGDTTTIDNITEFSLVPVPEPFDKDVAEIETLKEEIKFKQRELQLLRDKSKEVNPKYKPCSLVMYTPYSHNVTHIGIEDSILYVGKSGSFAMSDRYDANTFSTIKTYICQEPCGFGDLNIGDVYLYHKEGVDDGYFEIYRGNNQFVNVTSDGVVRLYTSAIGPDTELYKVVPETEINK